LHKFIVTNNLQAKLLTIGSETKSRFETGYTKQTPEATKWNAGQIKKNKKEK
jgi:hypothetical protein